MKCLLQNLPNVYGRFSVNGSYFVAAAARIVVVIVVVAIIVVIIAPEIENQNIS